MAINAQDFGGKDAKTELSFMHKNLFVSWCIYALMAFPFIDYSLHLQHIHPLGVVWDKIVLVILAVVGARRWMQGYKMVWFAWHKFAILYILYAFALVFAGLNHPVIAAEGFRTDIYYLLYAFLFPVLVAPRDVVKLLHAAASIAILIAVHGVYQYITKAAIPIGWLDVGEHVRTRVFSVLTSPNELGSYMALMIPLIIGLFLYEKYRWRKWFYGVGALVCFATQLFTFDRGSLLSLALATLIVAVFFQRKLLIILVGIVIIAYFIPSVHHRFADLLTPMYLIKAAQGGRIERWLTAFDTMSSNPLFGAGLGVYGGQVASDFHLGIYSDGYFMKVMGESGLIGLLLFLSFHIALLKEIVQKGILQFKGRERYVLIGGFTGLLAVFFHNFIENVFEFAPMVFMYLALATLFLIWGADRDASDLDSKSTS